MTVTTFPFTTPATITSWTVPFYTPGSMSAKLAGGLGGGSLAHADGGSRGRITGTFDLDPGTVITIICGEDGNWSWNEAGGTRRASKLTALFDVFDPDGHAYSVGDVASYDGVLYRVVQAHRSQADWTPDKVPALFKVHRTPEMTEWVAGIAVKAGERFGYGGATWEVVQGHTTQKGWEPDRVPSLWRKV